MRLSLDLTVALCYPIYFVLCQITQTSGGTWGAVACIASPAAMSWSEKLPVPSSPDRKQHDKPAAHSKAQWASRVAVLDLGGRLLGVTVPHRGHQPLLLRSPLLVHDSPKLLQLGDWLPKGSTSKLVLGEILVAFLKNVSGLVLPQDRCRWKKGRLQGCPPILISLPHQCSGQGVSAVTMLPTSLKSKDSHQEHTDRSFPFSL